jgi:hypothetical protein
MNIPLFVREKSAPQQALMHDEEALIRKQVQMERLCLRIVANCGQMSVPVLTRTGVFQARVPE